jgi:hypothetical protein
MLWIITQESPEEHYSDIFQRCGGLFKTFGGFDTHLIRGTGVEKPGQVKDKPNIMAQAEEMARKLVA